VKSIRGLVDRIVAGAGALAGALAGAGAGRGARDVERERVEDALKHLHECERAGRRCAPGELADRVGEGADAIATVAVLLTEAGLARSVEGELELTPAGTSYARRVLRTHRLWERYLADRTGVPAGEWHGEAERVEHELSPVEAERLARRLGDPRYDPHGDPIPTSLGEVPEPAGIPLTRARAGRSVVVLHLEDEPPEVFGRLVEAGLTPGLAIEVVDSAMGAGAWGGVRIRVRGLERELGVEEAANVTVEVLPAGAAVPGRRRTLAEAAEGEVVRVSGIAPTCQGPQRRRLLDLGVVPGTRMEAELVSPSGDPVAYRLRGALIALRREQAGWIEVEEAG
jgi:DtxR family transcriptional regulator, Mn-dependent transcriptional regulator